MNPRHLLLMLYPSLAPDNSAGDGERMLMTQELSLEDLQKLFMWATGDNATGDRIEETAQPSFLKEAKLRQWSKGGRGSSALWRAIEETEEWGGASWARLHSSDETKFSPSAGRVQIQRTPEGISWRVQDKSSEGPTLHQSQTLSGLSLLRLHSRWVGEMKSLLTDKEDLDVRLALLWLQQQSEILAVQTVSNYHDHADLILFHGRMRDLIPQASSPQNRALDRYAHSQKNEMLRLAETRLAQDSARRMDKEGEARSRRDFFRNLFALRPSVAIQTLSYLRSDDPFLEPSDLLPLLSSSDSDVRLMASRASRLLLREGVAQERDGNTDIGHEQEAGVRPRRR